MIPVVKRDVREIPLGLIDGPVIAMRDGFVDQAFDDLVASIRVNGIRVPLIVVARGERYVVVAGDRRYHAAKSLGMVTVPCDVQELGDDELEFVKVLENEDRAPVNAADAAAYFMRLFNEKCGEDVDQVCALVRRERRYVEDRLALFLGDEEVFNALKAGLISFGVARELNGITDQNYRRMHLDSAMKYGMTVAAAKETKKAANFATSAKPAAGAGEAAAGAVDAAPTSPGHVCYICNRSNNPERFRYVLVHEFCDLAIGQRVLSAYRESDDATGPADA